MVEIDVSKLSRDYSKFPLITTKNGIGSEYMPKMDIEYLYIELNMRVKDIAIWAKTDIRKIRRNIDLYNITKDISKSTELKKETNNIKYGGNSPLCSKNILKKSEETSLNRYGRKYYMELNSSQFYDKMQEKYGAKFASQIPEVQRKIHESKKRNGTYIKSKDEDKIFEILLTKFPIVKRQYHSKLYPFDCDFYIPELDLYIEYQGFKSHGTEPYNENKIDHQLLIKDWIKRSNELNFKGQKKSKYLDFINVWTIKDPLKRTVAKKNGLNWIEFFNLQQFLDWFDKI